MTGTDTPLVEMESDALALYVEDLARCYTGTCLCVTPHPHYRSARLRLEAAAVELALALKGERLKGQESSRGEAAM